MDKNRLKRHLHGALNPASEEECSTSSPKKPNIENQSVECIGVDAPLKETPEVKTSLECLPCPPNQSSNPRNIESKELDSLSTARPGCGEAEIKDIDSGDPFIKTEKSGLDNSCVTSSNATNMNQKKSKSGKKALSNPKSSEKQVFGPSREKRIPMNTNSLSKTRENPYKKGDSHQDAVAKSVELEYETKYASRFTKELLFAVDVMTFVRHLNHLESKWIIYNTQGEVPESPCNDVLEDVLKRIWSNLRSVFDKTFECRTISNYYQFQNQILGIAKDAVQRDYEEKYFLTYILMMAQLAVYAEKQGISDAFKFIPLAICQIIQDFKDAGKLPLDFWERMAGRAYVYISGFEESQ